MCIEFRECTGFDLLSKSVDSRSSLHIKMPIKVSGLGLSEFTAHQNACKKLVRINLALTNIQICIF